MVPPFFSMLLISFHSFVENRLINIAKRDCEKFRWRGMIPPFFENRLINNARDFEIIINEIVRWKKGMIPPFPLFILFGALILFHSFIKSTNKYCT